MNKSSDRSFFPILYFSTEYLIMFGKVMDQGPHTVFCIFTVMLSKMKMQTSQYRKSRIWEMKEDKYTSQESGLWNNAYVRCSQKRFTQICKALYGDANGDAMLMSIWGAQIWPPETNKNIWCGVFLLMREFIAWGIHKCDLTLHNVPYGFPCLNGQQFIYSSLAVQRAWTICSKKLSSIWTAWDIRSKKIVIPSNSSGYLFPKNCWPFGWLELSVQS